MAANDFGERFREILEARGMKQVTVAQRLGTQPQWVNQLIRGTRRPKAETLRRLAAVMGISVEELEAAAPHASTAVSRLEQSLEGIRGSLAARSCTTYVRDPLWNSEYRLAAMSNIKYTEPMHGFLSTRKDVALAAERFVEDARESAGSDRVRQIERIPHSTRHLFGKFSEREGVRAYARVASPAHADEPDAILFVNYEKRREFTVADRARHRKALASLLPQLPAVQHELSERDKAWLAEGARIVQPASSLTAKDLVGQDLSIYFRHLLESSLEALGIPIDIGFGAIHLYNPDTQMLDRAGSCGSIRNTERAASYSVAHGASTASWVVLHRRALLISNTRASEFGAIHIPLNDSVRSELVVPLDIDSELVGVLSLQCSEPNRFRSHHVRSVWYAANRIAIVHRLHLQAEMNRELLEICSEATRGGQGAEVPLTQLANLAVKYLHANSCNMWIYDSRTGTFTHGGSSDGGLLGMRRHTAARPRAARSSPRSRGFSLSLLEWRCPLWLGRIRDATHFDRLYWASAQWQNGTPGQLGPRTLNTALQGEHISCQLGLPIEFRGHCIGVAWVKFTRDRERPSDTLITLAQGFMAAAGLIVEALRHRYTSGTPRAATRLEAP